MPRVGCARRERGPRRRARSAAIAALFANGFQNIYVSRFWVESMALPILFRAVQPSLLVSHLAPEAPRRLLDHMGKTSRVDRAIIEIGHSQGAAPTGLFGVALRAYHLRVHAYFL